ncbi:MAG: B12-binding domain-containing radical SAM protein, partial [Burkholderiales bacterium]|nr:B12-binding domain-containing radical SAM protein [Burkholderiales bacterium]
YWDLIGNSGRFHRSLPLLLADAPFARFMAFADWLYRNTAKTHEFSLEKLCGYLHDFLVAGDADATVVAAAVAEDFEASGARGKLPFMARGTRPEPAAARGRLRQARHVH